MMLVLMMKLMMMMKKMMTGYTGQEFTHFRVR